MSDLKTLSNVGRYHLCDRVQYLVLPWSILTFTFLVNVIIAAVIPLGVHKAYYTGAVASIYCIMLLLGAGSVTRSLPFGFAVGLSRRSYYLGTLLLVAGLGLVYGLALTVLQEIERASGGWGLDMNFFRVPWLLNGAWYTTWLTSFVLLFLVYIYGMWFGLVYRRWQLPGLVTFVAAQVLVAVAVVLIAFWTNGWSELGRFFTTLSAVGFTGLLAALAALLALGGFATMRRVTV